MIDWNTAQITVHAVETTTGLTQELVITLDDFALRLAARILEIERLKHDREELDRARRFLEAEPVDGEVSEGSMGVMPELRA